MLPRLQTKVNKKSYIFLRFLKLLEKQKWKYLIYIRNIKPCFKKKK